jgi:hypothetical protein
MHADLPMRAARVEIAGRLLTQGLRLAFLVPGPAESRGGVVSCRRLTARRVRCEWQISAHVCDEEFTACEERPSARAEGVAWALKRPSGYVSVRLGSDARRRTVFPQHE